MTRTVAVSLDQFYRPQPGGISTYVRGLVRGLASLGDEAPTLVGLAPRGRATREVSDLTLARVDAPLGVAALTRAWAYWPLAVPAGCDVVHATSLAGPFGGGRRGAVHSVALHDLLWRDEPDASTPRGRRFHESRLRLLRRREDVRVLTTAPGLDRRLVADGFAPSRLFAVGLGVDEGVASAEGPDVVVRFLNERGVRGPFTLYVGTREPRKNLARLRRAHALARATHGELGPLVVAGPPGWGAQDDGDAVVLGLVSRELLRGLYRDAAVFAYVPRAEGFGLPPVEALHAGARVVASVTTPSVADNADVVRVDPFDVDAIASGLVAALSLAHDDAARQRRRASVASMTWRNVALQHLAAWR